MGRSAAPSRWNSASAPGWVSRRLLVALVIAAGGVVAGGVAWHRMGRVTPESDPVRYWIRESRRVFAAFPTAPVTDDDALRALLAGAHAADPEGALRDPAADADALRDAVAGFLGRRFTALDPDAYRRDMESAGYRLVTTEEFEAHGPLRRFIDFCGLEEGGLWDVFLCLWSGAREHRAIPIALCTEPSAAIIIIGRTNHNRVFTQRLEGALGGGLWRGAISTGCRCWFAPPTPRAELVRRHGSVVAAYVGIIVAREGGARHPIILNAFQDPATSRWWIDAVSATNIEGTPDLWTCVEF